MCLTKNTKNTCTTYKNIAYIPYLILRFIVCRRERGVRHRHTELEKRPSNDFENTILNIKFIKPFMSPSATPFSNSQNLGFVNAKFEFSIYH